MDVPSRRRKLIGGRHGLLGWFGRGSDGGRRSCPACEAEIPAAATYCPHCYLVLRPEGTAELRRKLQGAKLPSDVYLLRKLQVEDPTSPDCVVSAPRVERAAAEIPATSPVAPDPAPPSSPIPGLPGPAPATIAGRSGVASPSPPPSRKGLRAFLEFPPPAPPLAGRPPDLPALFAWMLEHDRVIPNNLSFLERLHAEVHRGEPVAPLGYRGHLLQLVADDLRTHDAREALDAHLALLAASYQRASAGYRAARGREAPGAAAVGAASAERVGPRILLWQMASAATRLRLESWIYRSHYGEGPRLPHEGRRRGLPRTPHPPDRDSS